MKPFSISKTYEENNVRTVYINPLPDKYCSFDCVFCPLGRTTHKTDTSYKFEGTEDFLIQLRNKLSGEKIDEVFINPAGEGLANSELGKVIGLIKSFGCRIKILSNGYVVNRKENQELLRLCDEVVVELMTVTEEDFQRLNRPLEGYTLKAYVDNMAAFNRSFDGQLTLSITLLKKYSDSEAALSFFRDAIDRIKPDKVYFETPEEEKLRKALGVDEETLDRFRKELEL